MDSKLMIFYNKQEEPLRSVYLALREIILSSNNDLSETIKYGMPCFVCCKKPICYLWKDKITQEPYVLWVYGDHLKQSELQSGTRKKMKILPIEVDADLPFELIKQLVNESIARVK